MPLPSFVRVKAQDPNGNPVSGISINPVKKHVRGYWVVSDPVTFTLAAGVGNVGEFTFLIDSQGHFDWCYLIGNSTADYSLQFFDPGTSRLLQNRPVPSVACVGSAQRPFRLPEPYFFNVGDSQRQLTVKLINRSASQNTVRLTLYGRRFYHHEAPPDIAQEIDKRFAQGARNYSYFLLPKEVGINGEFVTIPSGPTGKDILTFDMDNNADTTLQKAMVLANHNNWVFRLRERDTNRTLSNDFILSTNGWGNAEFPFLFADTYLLERNKQLLMEIVNTDPEVALHITPVLAGRRLQYA